MEEVTSRSLWLGAVQPSWTEEFLQRAFRDTIREEVSVKIHRSGGEDEFNAFPAPLRPPSLDRKIPIGYAFIEFRSTVAAKSALERLQNTPIPNTNVVFRLNWAMKNKAKLEAIKEATEFSIFVGDLSPDVTDEVLKSAFKQVFPSCSSANVVIDPKTGHSRSYGFVRFSDMQQGELALQRMNGVLVGKRPIRVGPATEKKSIIGSHGSRSTYGERTTVFIGKLSNEVTEDQLREHFQSCGNIIDVYVPPAKAHKGVGFVTFKTMLEASNAIKTKNGTKLGASKIRTAWGNNNQNVGGNYQPGNPWISASSYNSSPLSVPTLDNRNIYNQQSMNMLQNSLRQMSFHASMPNMNVYSAGMNQVNLSQMGGWYPMGQFPTSSNFNYNTGGHAGMNYGVQHQV
eukprot:maker-scaffold_16-snap-gene-4.7-mRNA-1 protein AED:0.01 eAED:0.01 QI:298/1/1/1/0.66/0.5/4/945/399